MKPQCRDAAKWIAAQFASFGIEQVEIRAWSPAYAGNVVATIPGTQTGGDVYVLGGHYDSIAPEARHEPGADDNASGTATLLECARLLASQQFEATVQIVAFGGEEYGLLGSEAYAQTAARRGERIVAMINLDMLGHLSPGDRRDLDIISNRGSEWLRDAARDVARQYVPQLSVLNGKLLSGTSDHASFWRAGYDAVFFYEDSAQPSPFIHTPDDVIGLSYNDVEFHSLCTKTAVALLATLARPVPVSVTIRAFSVQPEEAGVRVSWRLSRAARNTVTGIGVQRAASVQGPYVYCAQTLPPTTTQFVDTASHGKDLWYRLALEDAAGRSTYSRGQRASRSGRHSSLKQVYYTAAERAVGIRYEVAPSAQRVQLAVYDIRGRLVAQLVDAWVRPGMHFETWDGRDGRRNEISRGVYFIRLRGQRVSETRKLVVHANP